MPTPGAPPSSLHAPSRTRTITIDASLPHQQPPQMQGHGSPILPSHSTERGTAAHTSQRSALFPDLDDDPNSASSSDSDDDENDALNTSQGPISARASRVIDNATPSRDHARRSNSALSLESLQNESDGGEDEEAEEVQCDQNSQQEKDEERPKRPLEQVAEDVSQEPNSKRTKLDTDNHPNQNEEDDDDIVFVSEHKNGEGNHTFRQNPNGMTGRNDDAIAEVQGEDEGAVARCEIGDGTENESNGDDIEQQENQIVPNTKGNAGTGDQEHRYLVNIAPVSPDDGSGWDRSVFFSFRSQRFGFFSKTYLSTFSPFAAVASGMEGVTSKSVCAVCGSGGRLLSCSRCPLAFHQHCIDPLGQSISETWFCRACKAVKGMDRSVRWDPEVPPPELPSPATGFARLIADASEGNPLDFVFNPTLFNYYRNECGGDWLRCCRCKRIRIADDGVLTESVHVPFECSYAFWLPDELRSCESPLDSDPSIGIVKRVEAYVKNRSRRRNALFFYGFGEDDRTDFGFPPLEVPEASSDDVIIIDDDESDAALDDRNDLGTRTPSKNTNGSNGKAEKLKIQQTLSKVSDQARVTSSQFPRRLGDANTKPLKNATRVASGNVYDAVLRQDSLSALRDTVSFPEGQGGERDTQSRADTRGDGRVEKHIKKDKGPHQTAATGRRAVPTQDVSQKTVERRGGVGERASIATETQLADYALPAATPVAAIARDAVGSRPQSEYENGSDLNDRREESVDKTARPADLDEDLQEQLLEYIASLDLDTDIEDCLTDMALEGNKSIMRLYKVHHRNDSKFKRHASRLASKHMGKDAAGVSS
eukprot:GFKZ01008207.1.p1 GENE.GFKZ01008207.1~~GFKZ01008207.1.p1  ORF type:complete len:822 (+),score=122.02 GFKZ01008207.1:118-2583(+)